MATDLTTIFGSEITVDRQPRISQRQDAGYTGAHGLTSMALGSRGHTLTVRGILRATGASYAAARATLEAAIEVIEAYQWADEADYSYGNVTYYDAVFQRFQLIPGPTGQMFRRNGSGYVFVQFVCNMTVLI